MPKKSYHISLKGNVGGADFDRSTIDKTLTKTEGRDINVLIEKMMGSLANYFDYEAFGRELFNWDYNMGANGHVFRRI